MLAFNKNLNVTISLLIILVGYHLINITSINVYKKTQPKLLQQQAKVVILTYFYVTGDWSIHGFPKDQRSSQ